MLSRFIPVSVLLLLLCGFGPSLALTGEQWLSKGDAYYALRAQGAKGDLAEGLNAHNAVASYRLALADSKTEREASVRLMRSLYFIGCFTDMDDQGRLQAFTEAKDVGERMLAKHPLDADIAYWWSVNLALWAKESGPLAAIRSGFADKIRQVSELNLSSSPNPGLASMYQVLGRLHHLLPRIPFLLSWPDKKLAEEYLQRAVQLDPANPANHLFLAEFYRDMGRNEDAYKAAKPCLTLAPRPEQELEDKRNLWKIRELEASLRPIGIGERVAMAR